jgi:hypothetical protein
MRILSLLIVMISLAGCQLFERTALPQRVKVYTVPVVSKPIIPAAIAGPPLRLPEVVVVTTTEALYYNDACLAFKSIGFEGEDDLQGVLEQYPGLTQSAACEWAIYGFTVQGWLSLESQINEIGAYTRSLRARIAVLEGMLNDQYDSSKAQKETFERINEDNE